MNNCEFPHFNIVLVCPQIPPNTGNIGRTCVATGASLHLIKPLGFEINDKSLRRAGLDYWEELNFHIYDNIEDFFRNNQDGNFVFATKKTGKVYSQFRFKENDFIFFGSESLGLPEGLIKENLDKSITIPMNKNSKIRSLNLANSVSIILFQAICQCSDNFNIEKKEFKLK